MSVQIAESRGRMQEIWLYRNNESQEIILDKAREMLALDLGTSIKKKRSFFAKENKLTVDENNITLSKHNSEA